VTPRATYRLQLHAGFTFDDASAVVPYLADLGVSHAYVSPILTATAGSTHGYDVVDPTTVNAELGGEPALRRFVTALRTHGMGLVVDIVPNHMGVGGSDNPWWLDLLRHGRASAYAGFFDIDWLPPDPELHHRLLAPFLGTPYGTALDAGEITLLRDPAVGWAAAYYHHRFPVRPEDVPALEADPAALAAHDPATPAGRARLHRLLERQHWRLAWWRSAGDRINWRRFFDITSLAGLAVERGEVFDAVHATILRLYGEGLIDGLRIDHIDGLAEPGAYCRRLRAEMLARRPRHTPWLLVEKILAAGEVLEPSWQTDGTTGYDFMNEASLLLHNRAGLAALAADWTRRTGRPGFALEERVARAQTLERGFSAQLDAAAAALYRLAATDPVDRDRPPAALRRCLTRILVHFPRYRSYAVEGLGVEALHQAVASAEATCLPLDRDHLPRIADWLGSLPDGPHAELRREAIRRFEQLSAPLAAKAVEDTAFYRHAPLLSRNDVGFDPAERVGSAADWHEACARRAASFPLAMLATATHDHKRGEDLRARLAVLTEMPEPWAACLDRWLPALGGVLDAADAIMLLQMLVGGWPPGMAPDDAEAARALRDRLADWQQKALREAKRHSSWAAPDEGYEGAAAALLDSVLLAPDHAGLRAELAALVARIAPDGLRRGLVQTALKLTAPGVPDIYQGSEFLDFSLVDPDNRTPVDFAARAAGGEGADGDKQRLIASLLRLRRGLPELFAAGSYREIPSAPGARPTLLAFERRFGETVLVVACTRFGAPAENGGLASLVLPVVAGWHDILADRALPAGVLPGFEPGDPPVAVLLGHAGEARGGG
jgi:(1->4)-alpha-D-glucan 1-alpha-D-glucosylmutase